MAEGQKIDAWQAARDRATDVGIDIERGRRMPMSAVHDDKMSETKNYETRFRRRLNARRFPNLSSRTTVERKRNTLGDYIGMAQEG